MKLDKKQVEHIGTLARLELSPEEKEKFSHQLSLILDYVDQLHKVDVSALTPISQITGLHNVTRDDKAQLCEYAERVIACAPEHEGNLIKVKAVF